MTLDCSSMCVFIVNIIVIYSTLYSITLNLNNFLLKYLKYLRNKEDYVTPKFRINQLKRSFEYSAILTWNLIASNVRKSDNLKTFKTLTINTIQ